MNKIVYGLLFICLISTMATVTADNETINITGDTHGDNLEYTINYPDGNTETRNITHNQTNNLISNQTVEIIGETHDFELEPNKEPVATMKETGISQILLTIGTMLLFISLIVIWNRWRQ